MHSWSNARGGYAERYGAPVSGGGRHHDAAVDNVHRAARHLESSDCSSHAEPRGCRSRAGRDRRDRLRCRCRAFAVLGDAGLTDRCAKSPHHALMLDAVAALAGVCATPHACGAMRFVFGPRPAAAFRNELRVRQLRSRDAASCRAACNRRSPSVKAAVDARQRGRRFAAAGWGAGVVTEGRAPRRFARLADRRERRSPTGLGEVRRSRSLSSCRAPAVAARIRTTPTNDSIATRIAGLPSNGRNRYRRADRPAIAQRLKSRRTTPGLLPGYAGRTTWQCRGRLSHCERAGGRNVVVAPVYSATTIRPVTIERALALLDGTFFTEDELQSLGLPAKPASDGYLPIGAGGTLERVAAMGGDAFSCAGAAANPFRCVRRRSRRRRARGHGYGRVRFKYSAPSRPVPRSRPGRWPCAGAPALPRRPAGTINRCRTSARPARSVRFGKPTGQGGKRCVRALCSVPPGRCLR